MADTISEIQLIFVSLKPNRIKQPPVHLIYLFDYMLGKSRVPGIEKVHFRRSYSTLWNIKLLMTELRADCGHSRLDMIVVVTSALRIAQSTLRCCDETLLHTAVLTKSNHI